MKHVVPLVYVIFLLCSTVAVHGQCPNRQSLDEHIVALRSGNTPAQEQLEALLPVADSLTRCPVANDTVYAHLLQRIGALYFLTQDMGQAAAWTQRAAGAIKACTASPSNIGFGIKVYNYLARFYDSLGMPSAQMEAIDSLIKLTLQVNDVDPALLNNVLDHVLHRANYAFDCGDYQRSLDYANVGSDFIRLFHPYPADRESYGLNLFTSEINSLIHLREYEAADSLVWQMIGVYKKRNHEKDCGVFYSQLAQLRVEEHQYPEAIEFLSKALKCHRRTGFQVGCKLTLENIGVIYQNSLHDPDSALIYFRKASMCVNDRPENASDDLLETLNVYGNIANIFAQRAQFDSASVYFARAFSLLKPGLDENSLLHFASTQLPAKKDWKYITTLVKDRGDSYLLEYRAGRSATILAKAIRTYRIADEVLNRVRSEQAEVSSSLAWRANLRGLYEKAIDASILSNDAEAAFYFFEKSRSALLNDQISWQRLTTQDDIRKQVILKRRLADLHEQLSNADPSSDRYDQIQKNIYAANLESDKISMNIRRRDPMYYQNYVDTGSSRLEDLRKNILSGTHALLELYAGDSAVFAFFVSADTTLMWRVNKRGYDRLTADYIHMITHPAVLNRHYGRFVETANQLYHLLMGPCVDKTPSLIISPDGGYFPFESLVTRIDKGIPHYLLNDKAISYTYSARFLTAGKAGPVQDPEKMFFGMAPVSFAANGRLASLPGSDDAVKSIASRFDNAQAYTKTSASRKTFLDNFFKYRIIQLYTHGSGGAAGEEPTIFFSDSAVALSDIDPVTQPQTKLIVLSGCETGNGKFYQGEGVFSFNRTFASIGIPSAMVNLWSVDNQAVYDLTRLFYKYLRQGLPLDRSLQLAKLEFLKAGSKSRAMPYFWAPAVIVGKADAVMTPPDSLRWYWLIAIGIVVAAGIVFYRRRK